MVAPCVSSGAPTPGRGPWQPGCRVAGPAKLHLLLPTLHSCPRSCPCPSLEKPSSVRQSLWLKMLRALRPRGSSWTVERRAVCPHRGGGGRWRALLRPCHAHVPSRGPSLALSAGCEAPAPWACVPGGALWRGTAPGSPAWRSGRRGRNRTVGGKFWSWLAVCVNVRRCGS